MSHELARIEALEKRVTKLEKLLKSREGSEKWGEDSVVQQQQQQGQEISMKAGNRHLNDFRPYLDLLELRNTDRLEEFARRWIPEQTLKKAREIKKKRGKVDGD